MIYPNRLVLPLSSSADPQLVWEGQVSGLLVSVSGLPTKGGVRALFGQDKPDVYGVLSVGGERRQTGVAKNTVQHSYEEEWKEWVVEEVEGHLRSLICTTRTPPALTSSWATLLWISHL